MRETSVGLLAAVLQINIASAVFATRPASDNGDAINNHNKNTICVMKTIKIEISW